MKGLSYIGLGTAAIGRPEYINIRQEEKKVDSLEEFSSKGSQLIQSAYDLGIRYFDTAPGYGMAEQLIINWMNQNPQLRTELATKWGYTYTANFDPRAKIHEIKEHSIEKLNEQWEVSKSLLPQLRVYQIHSATFESNVLNNDSVLNRLAQLKEDNDLIIGISTTGANQLDVFEKALEIEVNGERLIKLFQVTYNVFDQSLRELIQHCEGIGVKVVVKEALANGRVFPNTQFGHYESAYSIIENISKKYGVGIDAVALRFCIESIPLYKVLSGASTIEHLKSNLKAAEFELAHEDLDALSSLSIPTNEYWDERKELAWN